MSQRNKIRKRRRYYLAKLGYPFWQVYCDFSQIRWAWLWVLKMRGKIGGGYLPSEPYEPTGGVIPGET